MFQINGYRIQRPGGAFLARSLKVRVLLFDMFFSPRVCVENLKTSSLQRAGHPVRGLTAVLRRRLA
ncbi:MAG TPA: hypothetical protein VGN31_01290 [Paraburkholderia sp.]